MSDLPITEQRAVAIIEIRKAAEALHRASESLREKLDHAEDLAREATRVGVFKQEQYDRLRRRMDAIREARNGMECFQLHCLVTEMSQAAWEELP